MEADRRHTTTGVEDLKSCFEPGLDLAELIVDRDAQALERSSRDVDVAWPGSSGYRRLDGGAQVAGGAERAPRHHELCDPARPSLLAVITQDPFDLLDVVLVHDPSSSQVGRWIHAHVERTFGAEAETALGFVELGARDPKVEQDHVGAGKAGGRGQLMKPAEATLNDSGGGPVRGQGLASGFDCGGIAVDPEQPSARSDPLEDQAGMARPPQGAVDRDRALSGL